MLRRLLTACVLTPGDVDPSQPGWEVVSAFNPGVAEMDGEIVLLVRVAERPIETREGYASSPRFEPEAGLKVDWFQAGGVVFQDPRAFESRETGNVRLTFVSHLRVYRSRNGREFAPDGAAFWPAAEEEEYGVEDARVTRLGDTFYFTYVAVSRHGACTALASTEDFKTFTRHGVIFPPENKDVLLFPETIAGDYVALHRPNPRYQFSPPEMWLARSPDLTHWGRHAVLRMGPLPWGTGRIGGGVPPMRVPGGWLEIYHGNERDPGGGVGRYVAGALLLDGENPAAVIGRTAEPVMAPDADFERSGFLNHVVFPTGLVERDGRLLVYYGAADASTGVVEFEKGELLGAIEGVGG